MRCLTPHLLLVTLVTVASIFGTPPAQAFQGCTWTADDVEVEILQWNQYGFATKGVETTDDEGFVFSEGAADAANPNSGSIVEVEACRRYVASGSNCQRTVGVTLNAHAAISWNSTGIVYVGARGRAQALGVDLDANFPTTIYAGTGSNSLTPDPQTPTTVITGTTTVCATLYAWGNALNQTGSGQAAWASTAKATFSSP